MSELGTAAYVSLTTLTRDGRPRSTPVWITDLPDGRLGFITAADSWKVRRARATPDVTLAICNARGRVEDGAMATSGLARIVDDDSPEFEQIRLALVAKYGWQFHFFHGIARLRHRLGNNAPSCGFVIMPK